MPKTVPRSKLASIRIYLSGRNFEGKAETGHQHNQQLLSIVIDAAAVRQRIPAVLCFA
jgi:hypothetical protein